MLSVFVITCIQLLPLLQESGLVPIVEPEVLLDGEHDIDATFEVAQAIWAETFKYMADNKVLFEGILLKPSMVRRSSQAHPPCPSCAVLPCLTESYHSNANRRSGFSLCILQQHALHVPRFSLH